MVTYFDSDFWETESRGQSQPISSDRKVKKCDYSVHVKFVGPGVLTNFGHDEN